MCGIAALSWCDKALIGEMTRVLSHRGPDQHGLHTGPDVSLGHRRLSIIDLSPLGRQPMCNETGTVWVTYNGEIYNFAGIRDDLIARGHKFRSRTDSEVIVHAYEEWQLDCVQRFNGIFAFVVWDGPRQQLVLCRDRLGVKPLYYAIVERQGRDEIVVASELKAVLACPLVDRGLDPQALYHYMGYEYVPAPHTILRAVKKLEPGRTLVWRSGEEPKIQRYWHPRLEAGGDTRANYAEQLRDQIQESVRKQLVSDVPLGVFLSGGLDSTALVCMMSRLGVAPLKTFSLYYEDDTFSEIEYARLVARKFGTEHHEILIDPVSPEAIEEMVYFMDEPMAELSAFALYILCKKARQFVTVCLSGEGGDEVFVGYDRFKASKANALYTKLPAWLRQYVVGTLVSHLPDRAQKKGAVNMIKRFIEGGLLPEDGGHMRWQYFLPPRIESDIFVQGVRDKIDFDPFSPVRHVLGEHRFADRLDAEILVDLTLMMPDAVCSKVDRMSMAHALEVRVPFLDHELVDLAGRIPGKWKLEGFTTKAIFRDSMKGILPEEIRLRGKQGYSLPIKNWLRHDLKPLLMDTLDSSPVVADYFDRRTVDRLVEEHMAMKANHGHLLWSIVALGTWHRLYVEQPLHVVEAQFGAASA
ncbi:MAG TPA: asparagine synthase (glutamine-hydrolyzing) [Dongiaceae bacterium]|nr:asparagine synthase (glutamine-hydrolyzing) [Dongiaceae bacterium]